MPTPTATGHLTFDRKTMLFAVNNVAPAAAGRGTSLPILAGIHMRTEGDLLRMRATNLELTIEQTIRLQDDPGPFDLVVPVRMFQRILRESIGDVTIERVDDESIAIRWARTVANLRTLPSDEFPRLTVVPDDAETFELNASDVDLIRKVANFASTDDARPILTGLRFSNDNPAGVAGTDSYRLGVAELSTTFPRDFLLPYIVAKHLPMKMLDTEAVTVRLGEREARFDFGDISITSVLIEGEFPPIARLIPEQVPCPIEFDRAELIRAVRTASVMFVDAAPVRLNIDPAAGTAQVVLACQDVGSMNTTVDVKILDNAPPNTCAFNPVYLNQLLESLNGDRVTLQITDSLKPMVVREGPWKMVIMPVRVS